MKVRLISGGAYRAGMTAMEREELVLGLRPAVTEYLISQRPDLVIVGDASGVDEWARDYCKSIGTDLLVGIAHWKALGKAAGMRRNGVMLTCATMYTAWDVRCGAAPGPKSIGTWAMVRECKASGIPVDLLGPWTEQRR